MKSVAEKHRETISRLTTLEHGLSYGERTDLNSLYGKCFSCMLTNDFKFAIIDEFRSENRIAIIHNI